LPHLFSQKRKRKGEKGKKGKGGEAGGGKRERKKIPDEADAVTPPTRHKSTYRNTA